MPYRSWCPVCVKARGKENAHRRKRAEESSDHTLPKVSVDYPEFKSKANNGEPNKDEKVLKIIVLKDEKIGCVTSHRVDVKGPGDGWIVKRIVQEIEELVRNSQPHARKS